MSTIYESEEYIELTKQLETLISEETIIHKKINVLMDKMQSLVSQYEKENTLPSSISIRKKKESASLSVSLNNLSLYLDGI